MNSNKIQNDLMVWARAHMQEIVVPNYYLGRYEADVLKVSRAGQLTEYEIKVSRADFKKDFQKGYVRFNGTVGELKHDQIMVGNRCNRFYFVCPEGLIEVDEVPTGFGLIYASELWQNKPLKFRIVKVSKLFKKEGCADATYRDLARNLTCKIANAKHRLERMKEQAIPSKANTNHVK